MGPALCGLLIYLSISHGLRLENSNITTYITTKSWVYHIAEDEFVPGNLLFADGNALKTTDGTTTSRIAGSSWGYMEDVGSNAQFRIIRSFVQLSRSLIVLADSYNHCFRNVDRTTNLTSPYSGSCTNRGDRDGLDALFTGPWSIKLDVKNNTQILITDFHLGSLKKIIVASKSVSTIYKDSSYLLSTLLQDPSTGNIYVTFDHGLGLLDYESLSFSVIAGSSSHAGFVDGTISQLRFYYPREVAFLCPHKLLIADLGNGRLRVLDLITNTSTSICSGVQAHLDGDLSSCQLNNPWSLLTVSEVIFVGDYRYIRSIQASPRTKITTAKPATSTTQTNTKDTYTSTTPIEISTATQKSSSATIISSTTSSTATITPTTTKTSFSSSPTKIVTSAITAQSDQSLQSSETTRPPNESNDNNNIIVIVIATSAVASLLIIAILVGYALKLRSRTLESNTNTPHRNDDNSMNLPAIGDPTYENQMMDIPAPDVDNNYCKLDMNTAEDHTYSVPN